MASVKPKGDGRWLMVWRVKTPAGEWVQSSRLFEGSRPDAVREANRLESEGRRSGVPGTGKLTLGAWLNQWHELREGTVANKTHLRDGELSRHLIGELGSKRLDSITSADLTLAYKRLLAKGPAPRTVHHVHACARKALRSAVAAKILPDCAADHAVPPKLPAKEMEAATMEDVEAVAVAAHDSNPTVATLLRFAFATGLRRGEALALTWSDVDLDNAAVRIVRSLEFTRKTGVQIKPTKTSGSTRVVALPASTVDMLRRHLDWQQCKPEGWNPNGLLFPNDLGELPNPDAVSSIVQWYARKAGSRLHLHALRHGHATALLQADVHPKVVQGRLGHSTISLTMNTYSHVIPGMDRAAADVLDRLLSGPQSGPQTHKKPQRS